MINLDAEMLKTYLANSFQDICKETSSISILYDGKRQKFGQVYHGLSKEESDKVFASNNKNKLWLDSKDVPNLVLKNYMTKHQGQIKVAGIPFYNLKVLSSKDCLCLTHLHYNSGEDFTDFDTENLSFILNRLTKSAGKDINFCSLVLDLDIMNLACGKGEIEEIILNKYTNLTVKEVYSYSETVNDYFSFFDNNISKAAGKKDKFLFLNSCKFLIKTLKEEGIIKDGRFYGGLQGELGKLFEFIIQFWPDYTAEYFFSWPEPKDAVEHNIDDPLVKKAISEGLYDVEKEFKIGDETFKNFDEVNSELLPNSWYYEKYKYEPNFNSLSVGKFFTENKEPYMMKTSSGSVINREQTYDNLSKMFKVLERKLN